MLMIRLQRTGKKNQPFFKVVVTEKEKSSTRGRFVEQVGFYNPLTKERSLKADRIKHWMSVGAQSSDTLYNMLVTEKVVEGDKRKKHNKSKKKETEETSAPATSAETTPEAETPAEAPTEQPKEEPVKEEQGNEAPVEQSTEPEKKPEVEPETEKEEPKAPESPSEESKEKTTKAE